MQCSAQGCKNPSIGDTPFCPAHTHAPRIAPAMAKAELVENCIGVFLKITLANCIDGSDGGIFRASSIFGCVSIADKSGVKGTMIHGEHGQSLPVVVPYERILKALEKRENDDD